MAVGAQDYIDQLLVKKYALEKVDNHESMTSMVRPEDMTKAMTDYASTARTMLALQQKLSAACYAINAASAQYRKAATLS